MKTVLLFIVFVTQLQVFCSVDKAKIDSVNHLQRSIVVSNLQKSIKIFEQNVEDARSINYKYGEAASLFNLGVVTYLNGKYEESTEIFLKAINLFEELKLDKELALAYGEFGYQIKRRNLKKAMEYMRMGISIAEKHNYKFELSSMYNNFGVLQEMNNNLDSTAFYYRKALKLKKEVGDYEGIPYTLNDLSGFEAMRGNFNEAFKLLRQSDEYRKKEKANYGRLDNLVRWGDTYFQKGDIDSAIAKYSRAINSPGAGEQNYLVRYCLEQLAAGYELKKDYRNAFLNQRKLSALKDSVLNFETNAKIAELEIRFDTEKKDHQISESNLELQKKSNQLLILLGFVVTLMFITFGNYLYQKQKRERIKRELELKNQLNKAELEKKASEEKLRIARELHDNIGSHLTFIISSLDNVTYGAKEDKVVEKLNGLSSFSRETLNELRNTIWAMKEEDSTLQQLLLKLSDLKHRLNEQIDNLNIQIKSSVSQTMYLTSAQLLNLYRIVQEAVQNSIKHADAKKIVITFHEMENGFTMEISDNGKGFDPQNANLGNGLKNMETRCKESGGSFEIQSGENGTTIQCSVKTK
ncbi:MAG: sensor histidine kinase [Ignavibacteriaceae bacterium]